MVGDGNSGAATPLGADGGTVLVVGDVPDDAHQSFARDVLGGDGERRRLLVFAGHSPRDLDRYLPEGAPTDPEHLRIVVHGGEGAREAPDHVDGSVVVTVPERDLPELGTTVSETVDSFDALAGGLDPGEFRLCFDSLGTVLDSFGETDAFGFLHILTERLGRADGVSAVHLRREDDHEVGMFGSLFDAVVELRAGDGRTECRWDLGDGPGEWRAVGDD